MAHRGSGPGTTGRRRLFAGLLVAATTAAGIFVLTSPGTPAQQLVTGARPTSTTTVITTPPPPYSNPSVELSALVFTASKASTSISGSFVIDNVSGALPTDVLVIQQRVTVEYKTTAGGKYTMLAAPTCSFTPTVSYTIPFQQEQAVTFNCTLAAPFPATAKFVRVTVVVNLQGRNMDFKLAEDKAL